MREIARTVLSRAGGYLLEAVLAGVGSGGGRADGGGEAEDAAAGGDGEGARARGSEEGPGSAAAWRGRGRPRRGDGEAGGGGGGHERRGGGGPRGWRRGAGGWGALELLGRKVAWLCRGALALSIHKRDVTGRFVTVALFSSPGKRNNFFAAKLDTY